MMYWFLRRMHRPQKTTCLAVGAKKPFAWRHVSTVKCLTSYSTDMRIRNLKIVEITPIRDAYRSNIKTKSQIGIISFENLNLKFFHFNSNLNSNSKNKSINFKKGMMTSNSHICFNWNEKVAPSSWLIHKVIKLLCHTAKPQRTICTRTHVQCSRMWSKYSMTSVVTATTAWKILRFQHKKNEWKNLKFHE